MTPNLSPIRVWVLVDKHGHAQTWYAASFIGPITQSHLDHLNKGFPESAPFRSVMLTEATPPAPQAKPLALSDALDALLSNIEHAVSSGAWNVQKGSQTWEIIQEARAAHGIVKE